jgi:hypothetical protein
MQSHRAVMGDATPPEEAAKRIKSDDAAAPAGSGPAETGELIRTVDQEPQMNSHHATPDSLPVHHHKSTPSLPPPQLLPPHPPALSLLVLMSSPPSPPPSPSNNKHQQLQLQRLPPHQQHSRYFAHTQHHAHSHFCAPMHAAAVAPPIVRMRAVQYVANSDAFTDLQMYEVQKPEPSPG